MKKKYLAAACLSIMLILFSCAGRKTTNYFPVPDSGIPKDEDSISIDVGNIIETKNGSTRLIPAWLRSFLNGGIEAVEKLEAYSNKYVFIGVNEGENITALNKWADFYTVTQDFPMLAAARIEKRMYLTASLYPDDEYGRFYEAMIHNAYNAVYPDAVKEDIYWIKTRSENAEAPSENYEFFVLITIDKILMQTIIRNMISNTAANVIMTAVQSNSVNRLRNTFFEGF
ncbi:hypothetical protein R84B8_02968 [Treponema sp. R8-4-B8]